MRGILVLLGLILLAGVVAIQLNILRIDWKTGQWPSVEVKASSGKWPTVETPTVETGTTNVTVQTPSVEMKNTVVTMPTIEVKPAKGEPEKK